MATETAEGSSKQREKAYVIVDFLDLDVNKLTFLKPKKGDYGLTIPIRYEGKMLYVKYGRKNLPFGVSASKDQKKDPSYEGGQKITGYNVALGFSKDYENDPYFQKANEIDEYMMDVLQDHHAEWGHGVSSVPLDDRQLRGIDKRGTMAIYKRIVKWSYKKDEKNNIEFLDYPPRLEFNIQCVITEQNITNDAGATVKRQQAKFQQFSLFNAAGEQYADFDSTKLMYCPAQSEGSCLAHWSKVSSGTWGVSLKPTARQLRVYPRETLPMDSCFLDDNEEEVVELQEGDGLGDDGVAGYTDAPPVTVAAVPVVPVPTAPAPVAVAAPAPTVATIQPRTVKRRGVVKG